MVEQFLIDAGTHWPPGAVAALLFVAAMSFLARHRTQAKYGRIREYTWAALGPAAALGGLGALYLVIYRGDLLLEARPFVVRGLLSLLALSSIAFNWGGIRASVRDIRKGLKL